jgi:hypothetical protein
MATGVSFSNGFVSSPTGEGSASNEGSGVLGILQEQRDRFRRRMLELEQELESVSGKEKRSRELLEKTRAENVALADRVRLLRTTNRGGVDMPMAFGANGTPALAGGRSPLQLILRLVSANSFARTALVVYITALHLLVLFSASTSSESRDDGAKAAALRKND